MFVVAIPGLDPFNCLKTQSTHRQIKISVLGPACKWPANAPTFQHCWEWITRVPPFQEIKELRAGWGIDCDTHNNNREWTVILGSRGGERETMRQRASSSRHRKGQGRDRRCVLVCVRVNARGCDLFDSLGYAFFLSRGVCRSSPREKNRSTRCLPLLLCRSKTDRTVVLSISTCCCSCQCMGVSQYHGGYSIGHWSTLHSRFYYGGSIALGCSNIERTLNRMLYGLQLSYASPLFCSIFSAAAVTKRVVEIATRLLQILWSLTGK